MPLLSLEMEITASPIVRDLIGRGRIERFRHQHPLASGLRALADLEGSRAVGDFVDLLQLEIDARAIVTYLVGKGHDSRLGDDLSDERDCAALIFEGRVATLLFEPYVNRVVWRRYDGASSDLLIFGPRMQVECTQASNYDLEAMLDKATSKRKLAQRRDADGPYLLVVGTRTPSDLHIFRDITQDLQRKMSDWHGRHPEIAGIYFCAPQPIQRRDAMTRVDEDELTLRVNHYTGFAIRNLKAHEPLPTDFEKNWTADGYRLSSVGERPS